MLQANLISAIAKKIKDQKEIKDQNHVGKETLEESSSIQSTPTHIESYNPDFMGAISNKINQIKKTQTFKKVLVQESFNLEKMKIKIENDLIFMQYLQENFIKDHQTKDFELLVEGILDDCFRLHQECDLSARNISPAILIQENQEAVVGLYKNFLNKKIDSDFTRPIREGTASEKYKEQFMNLTNGLIQEGETINLDLIQVYLPFEETTFNSIKEIIIPVATASRYKMYTESTKNTDLNILSETAEDINDSMSKKIRLMTAIVAPNLFSAISPESEDASSLSGITIASDKLFGAEANLTPKCGMQDMDSESKEEYVMDEEADSYESDSTSQDEGLFDGADGGLGSVGKKENAIDGMEANDEVDKLMKAGEESAEPTEHEIDLDVPEEFDSGEITLPGESTSGENLGNLADDPDDIDDFEHLKTQGIEDTLDTNDEKIDELKKKEELQDSDEPKK